MIIKNIYIWILFTSVIFTSAYCYSVNEELDDDEDPDFIKQLKVVKVEKSIKLKSNIEPSNEKESNGDEQHESDEETTQKYLDELKKYKNYGYLNPSVATFTSNKPIPYLPQQKSIENDNKPIFHFQRRLDEINSNLDNQDDEGVQSNQNTKAKTYIVSNPRYNFQRNSNKNNEQVRFNNNYKNSRSSKIKFINNNNIPIKRRISRIYNDENIDKGNEELKRKLNDNSENRNEEVNIVEKKTDTVNNRVRIVRTRTKKTRSLEDEEVSASKTHSTHNEEALYDGHYNNETHTYFIPTAIPDYQYTNDDTIYDGNATFVEQHGGTTENAHASTYFLPTRPIEDDVVPEHDKNEGLASFYNSTVNYVKNPILFVTAINNDKTVTENPYEDKMTNSAESNQTINETEDQESSNSDINNNKVIYNETVAEEINEKKNFSIEDFYNAFGNAANNLTEYPNRHRDQEESIVISSTTTESTVSSSSTSNSFLGVQPHFPSLFSQSSALEFETSRAIKYPCTCNEGKCGCCTGRIMSNFNFNIPSRGCLNITYIPEDFEFNVKMSYNDRTLVQRRVSGKNPRPLCVPLPRITGRASACVKLSNVYLVGRNVHMCLDLEAKVKEEELFKVSFDCVRMGTNGIKWIKPEEGGGLGPPPVVDGPAPDDYDAIVASEGDEITSAKQTNKKKGVKQNLNKNKKGSTIKEE